MPYLLDSDVVIDHLTGRPAIQTLLERLQSERIAISSVTYMEVFEGILHDADRANAEEKFQAFLDVVLMLPFAVGEAQICARFGRRSRSRYLDLMIAATAIEHGLTLVTRNVADYRDVPGLDLASPEHLEEHR